MSVALDDGSLQQSWKGLSSIEQGTDSINVRIVVRSYGGLSVVSIGLIVVVRNYDWFHHLLLAVVANA
ncbi:hypothetical protein PENPOL_c028G04442 [Penicillium polonicum]|uniref:Uncharacterized protein n=1 Tax=Penicillium polonicum TaxID=60169 RepID=A0A1V6N5U3_PENPO|nr:hypothetical protein PENPOL_c028G04442 [Penicillium polonicum]